MHEELRFLELGMDDPRWDGQLTSIAPYSHFSRGGGLSDEYRPLETLIEALSNEVLSLLYLERPLPNTNHMSVVKLWSRSTRFT